MMMDDLDSSPAARFPPVTKRGDPDSGEMSLLAVVNVLLARWKALLGIPFAVAVLAAGVSLVLPKRFTASTTFIPEVQSSSTMLPGALAGIAAQFDLGVPAGGESPQLYADIIESRTLRDQILAARFPDFRTQDAADSAALLDILRIKGDTEAKRFEKGREQLDQLVSVSVDALTTAVTIYVETPYPSLSADVANLFVELLNKFNLETRQSIGREQHRFVGERLREAKDQLHDAEEELRIFLETNRLFESSSDLGFQYERLQRQVRIREELFITLGRQAEEARIQEVNDTRLITVFDPAVPPVKKSSPKRTLIVMVSFFLAVFTVVMHAFGRRYFDRMRAAGSSDFNEFTSNWASIRSTLRIPTAKNRS